VKLARLESHAARVLAILGLLALLFGLAHLLAGCASVRDDAVAATNGAADLGTGAERILEDLDRREQLDAVRDAANADEARAAVAKVRARYRDAWAAYRRFRLAWLAAASAERAYDASVAAKRTPDVAHVLAAAASLADAAAALEAATQKMTTPQIGGAP